MLRTLCGICLLLTTVQAADAPAFEVASVKPAGGNSRMGADYRVQPGGALTITNLSLATIIRIAYDLRFHQLTGGPAWLNQDEFDIQAKPAGAASREQVQRMLRTLLADRFKLQIRQEAREGNVYALVVAKSGHKLEPPTGERSWVSLLRLTPPELPGVKYAMQGRKASMDLFAQKIYDRLGTPVVNRTGLQGEFDFKVEYAINDNPETGAPLLVALQEQLGLKLEPAKGMVEKWVVDHVEKPSAN